MSEGQQKSQNALSGVSWVLYHSPHTFPSVSVAWFMFLLALLHELIHLVSFLWLNIVTFAHAPSPFPSLVSGYRLVSTLQWFPDRIFSAAEIFDSCSVLLKLCGTCPSPSQGLLALWWLGCVGTCTSLRVSHILQRLIARMGRGKVPSWACWKMSVACKALQATSLGGGCVRFLWSLWGDERREISHQEVARGTISESGRWVGDREELKRLLPCLGSQSFDRVSFP